jgi:hypothetical protein
MAIAGMEWPSRCSFRRQPCNDLFADHRIMRETRNPGCLLAVACHLIVTHWLSEEATSARECKEEPWMSDRES